MTKSLLLLPDISGYTKFVQSTEALHSQHVIAELLEVLIEANTQDLLLAEIEGDALFFYKEEIPSLEKILAQVETMFTAFHSHLKLLEKNRICPCNACATASNLELKIIIHSGEIQFITVQNKRKPFGTRVIEAHRLMKNSVDSNNYTLLSNDLAEEIGLTAQHASKLFNFQSGKDTYDGKQLQYLFSTISTEHLKLKPFSQAKKYHFSKPPNLIIKKEFPIAASQLLELLTNYAYRHLWVKDAQKVVYNEHEVTRIDTEHVCVINGKHLNFITITKDGKPGQLVYGELTTSIPIADEVYQFFIITPLGNNSCKLEVEIYLKAKSPIKKVAILFGAKKMIAKGVHRSLDSLLEVTKTPPSLLT